MWPKNIFCKIREFFGTESASEPMLMSWQMRFEQRRPDGKIGPWFREKPTEITLPLSLEKVMQGGEVEAVMMRRELNINGSIEVKEHRIAIDLQPGTLCGSSFLFPKQGHQAPFSISGNALIFIKLISSSLVFHPKVMCLLSPKTCPIQYSQGKNTTWWSTAEWIWRRHCLDAVSRCQLLTADC